MADFSSDDDALCELALTQYEAEEQRYNFTNPVTEKDLDSLAELRIPSNTRKNMTWAINSFKSWHVAKNRFFLNRLDENDRKQHMMPWTNLQDMTREEDGHLFLPG